MMRLAAAILALFLGSARAQTAIQQYLVSLRLGDTLEQIKMIYPPTQEWPKFREPGGRVVRINIERGYSKWFPPGVATLRLGMRRGRLVHMQLIHDRDESKRKPLEQLVLDLALVYGEPRRSGEAYFWADGSRILAVSNEELPTGREEEREVRTSLELMDEDYYPPLQ
ncbi:MAG: hypothetical protein WC728_12950 [Elusimicrobiota bacterium]